MVTHDILFGLVAWKLGFVTRDDLLAVSALLQKESGVTLNQLLVERKVLSPEHRDMLVPLIEAFLERHEGDPQRCIESLSSVSTIQGELADLLDPDRTVIRPDANSTIIPAAGSSGSGEDSQSSASRFQIIRPHAKGGLGQVSVARDLELNREVALKEIQQRHLHDAASRERFVLEAEITGGLQHPGIVPVYGLGRFADGSPFYAMRFIRGDSLKAAIEAYHQPETHKPKAPDERKRDLRKLLA